MIETYCQQEEGTIYFVDRKFHLKSEEHKDSQKNCFCEASEKIAVFIYKSLRFSSTVQKKKNLIFG